MSKIRVCALRPLNSKERADHGDSACIQRISSESFIIKDEKEPFEFSFDKVFYPGSEQADVYEFLARPIVQGAIDGRNGAIVTYGHTGAGKTYNIEGPGIMVSGDQSRGLLPSVVEELFEAIKFSDGSISSTIKLSMVEIYMKKIRDLFNLSKDNIQIKESKCQEINLSGVTEKFEAYDSNGAVSAGDKNKEFLVRDIWVFEKSMFHPGACWRLCGRINIQ